MSVTIVTGPPGAGKSTVSALLARSRPLSVRLAGDQVFHWIISGYEPPWMPGTIRQNETVTAAIAASARRFVLGGYDVFVDAIVGPWFLAHFLRAAELEDGPQYVILRPSRQVALARATSRADRDDLVDRGPVDSMYTAFEDLGSFEAHVLDSSNQDAAATVGTLEDGLRQGRYRLGPQTTTDMTRLAERFGIVPPPSDRSHR
jgi:AAA domain